LPVVIPRCHSFTFNLTTKVTAGGEVIIDGYATKKIEGDVVGLDVVSNTESENWEEADEGTAFYAP
jgi:hypothetical protein